MGVPLTPGMASRKWQVLNAAKLYFVEHGRSPSYGEIAAQLGVTKETIKGHVRALERDGLLVRDAGSRRGIRFPDRADELGNAEILRLARERGLGMFADAFTLPSSTLPMPIELEHIPDIEIEVGHAEDKDQAG